MIFLRTREVINTSSISFLLLFEQRQVYGRLVCISTHFGIEHYNIGMYFYEVFVNSQRYHGLEPLTYSCEEVLNEGTIVAVPFGARSAIGIINQTVKKPDFNTKAIDKVLFRAPIPAHLLALHHWLADYYPGPLGFITQLFVPVSIHITSRQPFKASSSAPAALKLPDLTEKQQRAVSTISKQSGSFLLHGETGSGKTRVYQELAKQALQEDKSSIILTPEIGLTPQLAKSFEDTFPGKVVIIHSNQTPAERREAWKWIVLSDKPLIIIGPRSALFSPVRNPGLIVIDEAHDNAYKQEQMPYYQTSRVAAKLSELSGAKLVLGSATPPVQDYFVFEQKKLPIIVMEHSALKRDTKVTVEIVDLKNREDFTRSPWLSNTLLTAVEASLNNSKQSLIFLNRRGTARLVLCQNCGWQAMCPRCDLPLTYHGDSYELRCHTCGFTSSPPSSCPVCHKPEIQFKSVGTKTIVDEIKRLFPRARVQRFDSDTTKAERLEAQFDKVISGDVDILVGTQMLSKGLDLPNLTVVGVVLADTSLYFPDYTAEERTFQMLRQVIGRVGRGHADGSVVIQSYHSKSTTLSTAVSKNYEQFYNAQLEERKTYRFPPFYFVLKIVVERSVQSTAQSAAHELAQKILQQGFVIELSGPSPAFVEKSRNKYRWQLVVKSKQRSELTKIVRSLPKNCMYDLDPTNLL